MKLLILGDIHGSIKDIQRVNEFCNYKNINAVIQVGDFGLGFRDPCPVETAVISHTRPWFTCLGNHDNWIKYNGYQNQSLKTFMRAETYTFKNYPHYRFVFFGGTESVDSHNRLDGVTWWAEETPSALDFDLLYETLNKPIPTIVISHDAPTKAHPFEYQNYGLVNKANVPINHTSSTLQKLFDNLDHKPEYWFFGHHHEFYHKSLQGTQFYCCGLAGQAFLLDLKTMCVHPQEI